MKQGIIGLFTFLAMLLLAACSASGSPETPASPTSVPLSQETAVLPAATSTAAENVVPTPAPLTSPLGERMDAWLSRQTETNAFKGAVLIAQGDEIVLARGYGMADEESDVPNTPATKFRIGDLTKPFTAMAIMQLVGQGKLDVQDPICDYLDDCPDPWSAVTIHHLLTNTSGIPDYLSQAANQANKNTPLSPDQLLAPVKELPLEFAPGDGWAFSSTGFLLLGQIIEQLSGQPYATFLQEHFFGPLNMAGTGLDEAPVGLARGYKYGTGPADPVAMQNLFAAGDMYSTVEDLYRWMAALDTDQLVTPETLDLILTAHAAIDTERNLYNGYGWILDTSKEHPNFGFPGYLDGYSAVMLHYVEDDLTIIVLTNQENSDAADFGFDLKDMVLDQG